MNKDWRGIVKLNTIDGKVPEDLVLEIIWELESLRLKVQSATQEHGLSIDELSCVGDLPVFLREEAE